MRTSKKYRAAVGRLHSRLLYYSGLTSFFTGEIFFKRLSLMNGTIYNCQTTKYALRKLNNRHKIFNSHFDFIYITNSYISNPFENLTYNYGFICEDVQDSYVDDLKNICNVIMRMCNDILEVTPRNNKVIKEKIAEFDLEIEAMVCGLVLKLEDEQRLAEERSDGHLGPHSTKEEVEAFLNSIDFENKELPYIKKYSLAESLAIYSKAQQLQSNGDIVKAKQYALEFPYDSETLQQKKLTMDIKKLILSGHNLYNAVQQYGEHWYCTEWFALPNTLNCHLSSEDVNNFLKSLDLKKRSIPNLRNYSIQEIIILAKARNRYNAMGNFELATQYNLELSYTAEVLQEMKEKYGVKALIDAGLNLFEAVHEYGLEWLNE